eukprot:GAHX01001214.1.p1 GENE.GAHX01001214.1~~GAHX01001214.1.p1  ORF type:complete len:712 (-),score=167.50 GAHX01001214.1:70-2205(-)
MTKKAKTDDRKFTRRKYYDIEAEENEQDEKNDNAAEQEEGNEILKRQQQIADIAHQRNMERQKEMISRFDEIAEREYEMFEDQEELRKVHQVESQEEEIEEEPQLHHLPRMGDARAFLIRCKAGKETLAMTMLARKICKGPDRTHHPIHNIYMNNPRQGYFYIEAKKIVDVIEALKGIPFIQNRDAPILVPLVEVSRTFTQPKSTMELSPGAFAIVKGGLYSGDIAQVISKNIEQQKYEVRLVPRIDLESLIGKNKKETRGTQSKSKPMRRLITDKDLQKHSIEYRATRNITDGFTYYLVKGKKLREGFLYIKLSGGRLESINSPDAEETKEFISDDSYINEKQRNTKNVDKDKPKTISVINIGDRVRVASGEKQNLEGVVCKIEKDVGFLKIENAESLVEVKLNLLQKAFKENDAVVVLQGKYKNREGLVLSQDFKNEQLKIFDGKEIIVTGFSNVTSSLNKLNKVKSIAKKVGTTMDLPIGKIIQYEEGKCGIILEETYSDLQKILTMEGERVRVEKSSLKPLKTFDNPMVFGMDGKKIKIRNIIRVNRGPYVGLVGTVFWVYRDHVFVQAFNMSVSNIKEADVSLYENYKPEPKKNPDKIFVIRSDYIILEKNRELGNEKIQGTFKKDQNSTGYGNADGFQNYAQREKTRENLKKGSLVNGKQIKITKGPYKARIGIVKSYNCDNVVAQLVNSGNVIKLDFESFVEVV